MATGLAGIKIPTTNRRENTNPRATSASLYVLYHIIITWTNTTKLSAHLNLVI